MGDVIFMASLFFSKKMKAIAKFMAEKCIFVKSKKMLNRSMNLN